MSLSSFIQKHRGHRALSWEKVLGQWFGLQPIELIGLFLSLGLIVFAIIISTGAVKHKYEEQIRNELMTLLQSTDEAILLWGQEREIITENLANDKVIRKASQDLLLVPHDQQSLLSSPAQHMLRTVFENYLKGGTLRGFFIIDKNNINLASSQNTHVGHENLLKGQPDILALLWQGKSVVSRVMPSDVSMLDQDAVDIGTRDLTMFAGAPIYNDLGEIIALLTLKIDPNQTLFKLLNQVRSGTTGEAYLFDSHGLMLSPSRFRADLIDLGLIGANETNATKVYVQTLGIDLLTLTTNNNFLRDDMFRQSDVQGLLDYRGVKVVCAWQWQAEQNLGLTVKKDYTEAYEIYLHIRNLIYVAGAVSIIAVLMLVFFFRKSRGRLREVKNRLAAVVEHTVDSIIIINDQGIIESLNPATETVFGYDKSELIGQNVKMLMPEPHFTRHDGYLAHFNETREAKVIGIGREVEALKADGSLFPAELSVSMFELDSGLHFSGTLRDISQRKEVEAELETERYFSQMALDSLGAQITILDESHRIVSVNQAWRKFLHENGLPEDTEIIGENYIQLYLSVRDQKVDDIGDVTKNLECLLNGESESLSLKFPCHQSGKVFWFQILAAHFNLRDKPMIVVSHTEITERYLAEEMLRNEKLEVESVNAALSTTQRALDRAKIGEFWLSTQSGAVLNINERVCEYLGYSHEEMTHMKIYDFIPTHTQETYSAVVKKIREQGWWRLESFHQAKDGRMIPVEVIIEYSKAEDPKDDMLIAFTIDITERKMHREQLHQAKEMAELANQAKSAFLATMSHEIRTPLNGVVGTIELLNHTPLNPEQLDMLRTVQESSSALLSIIDNVLDFSKIEAGRLDITHEPISIRQVVESCGESLNQVAAKKGVELLIYCDPTMPEVLGDSVRIRQILLNLVGNAIKFSADLNTRQGCVQVYTSWRERDHQVVELTFEVRDNGIGIEPEMQQRLFQPFVQAESSTTRRFGGTGLGLVISNRLATMMDGHLSLESQPNQGTTFSVTLPLTKVKTEPHPTPKLLADVSVLLIEGDPLVTQIVDSYLRYEGASIVTTTLAHVNDSFLQFLDTKKSFLVVIDTQSLGSDISSYQDVFRRYNSNSLKVRFLLLGRGGRRYARLSDDDTISLDINAMLFKTLINTVAALADIESLEINNLENNFDYEVKLQSIEQAREKGCHILVADDNEINRKVIQQQLEMLGFVVECAEDGLQALNMWRKGDYTALITDCHMPKMDGYELSRSIRSEENSDHHLPIIAVTADALKGTAQACHAAGMDDYQTKPIRLESLAKTLKRWVPMVAKSAGPIAEKLTQSDENFVSINPKVLPELLGIDDLKTLQEFYLSFLTTSEPIVVQINQSDLAVEVGQLAHKLKSSALTIGAESLAESCFTLETAGKSNSMKQIQLEKANFNSNYAAVQSWIEGYLTKHS
jgi:PAS domain S-box-containing protein